MCCSWFCWGSRKQSRQLSCCNTQQTFPRPRHSSYACTQHNKLTLPYYCTRGRAHRQANSEHGWRLCCDVDAKTHTPISAPALASFSRECCACIGARLTVQLCPAGPRGVLAEAPQGLRAVLGISGLKATNQ